MSMRHFTGLPLTHELPLGAFVHVKQAIFELSPLQLHQYLMERIPESQLAEEGQSVEDEDEITEPQESTDSEQEHVDEDIPSDTEREELMDEFGEPLVPSQSLIANAELQLDNIYALSVVPTSTGHMRCVFAPPLWMDRRFSGAVGTYLNKLKAFIHAAAGWLEDNKQGFLAHPEPRDFALGERDFRIRPVVTQEGLLDRIDSRLSQQNQVRKDAFSRLRPKLWLIWERQCMPLGNLFSRQVKVAWVIEGCRCLCDSPEEWRQFDGSAFKLSKEKVPEATQDTFASQGIGERLFYLFRRAGLRSKNDLQTVLRVLSSACAEV